MKQADNFDPGKWLVENKLTKQSQLNEMPKIQDPTTPIKDYILKYFNYNEDDFQSNYNADSGLDDLVNSGEYVEYVSFDDNEAPDDFYENLIKLIKKSKRTKHNPWGDYYEERWELNTYPFEDTGENWTEYLVVNIQIPNNETDIKSIFSYKYSQTIEIARYVPFDENMKQWWIDNYGE
jgi:hypothetical protein